MATQTSAHVVADSVGPNGVRITTVCATFPRIVLAELNTHREFSRNAASSRAIPIAKMIARVLDDPFVPDVFLENQAGMQPAGPLPEADQERAAAAWLIARDQAVACARKMAEIGVAKEIANRPLEPFSWTTDVITSTSWNNFFSLRYHPMAQRQMQQLARAIYEAMGRRCPRPLQAGEWHLPFLTTAERALYMDEYEEHGGHRKGLCVSAARCARTSYLNHDGRPADLEEDLRLFDRLATAKPPHASPMEHQARALSKGTEFLSSGNFKGWLQFRQVLPGQYSAEFAPPKEGT